MSQYKRTPEQIAEHNAIHEWFGRHRPTLDEVKALNEAGFRVGSVAEFLRLTEAEARIVESRLTPEAAGRMSDPEHYGSFVYEMITTPGSRPLMTGLAGRIQGTCGEAVFAGLRLLEAALDARDAGQRLVIVDDAANTEEDVTDVIDERSDA